MDNTKPVYNGLHEQSVYLVDKSATSPELFVIKEFPTQLNAGKNLFKLRGHPRNLREDSVLYIEILDYNNEPIYHEITEVAEEDGSVVIAIYIYDTTPPGNCTVTVVGEALYIDNEIIPYEWQNQSNVMWQRTVLVNSSKTNTAEIIFDTKPTITIQEQISVQLDRTYNTTQIVTYDTGSVQFISNNGTPTLLIDGGEFTSEMVGGTVTIASPLNPFPRSNYITGSIPYSSIIEKVLSTSSILLRSDYLIDPSQSLSGHRYDNFEPSTYSIKYESTPLYVPTENSESYALIEISDLQPVSGDVARIKVFANNSGTVGSWDLLSDVVLGDTEIFITNTSSIEPYVSVGLIKSSSIIDTYYDSTSYDGFNISTTPTIIYSNNNLTDALYINSTRDISRRNNVDIVKLKDQYNGKFIKGASYKFTLNAIGNRTTATGNTDPIISFYLSGSSFNTDYTDYFNQELPITVGKRIGYLQCKKDKERFDDNTIVFTADNTGTGILYYVIEGGQWEISNIHVTTNNNPGFTPEYTRIRTKIPTTHKSGVQQSFKVEYYNSQGVKSEHSTISDPIEWVGGNHYIDGDHNLITGSVFVADKLSTGIEFGGRKHSGYIRTVGYNGFNAKKQGILIWSGSALSGSTDNYKGTGVELYADDDNYFRFATDASETSSLYVKTKTFYLGNSTSSISSDGTDIHISGSVTFENVTVPTASYALTASYYAETDPIFTSLSGSLATTGSNVFSGSQVVYGNLTIYGTASYTSVTGSSVNTGNNTITLNTNNPSIRYGGMQVVDTGSFGNSSTGSMLWDSQKNRWIYTNPSGSSYDGGLIMSGPRNTNGIGEEEGVINNFLLVGQGSDHISSSAIFHSSSITQVTGSLLVTAGITGSLLGTASWANNAITASYVNPLVQKVVITGSILVNGASSQILMPTGSVAYSFIGATTSGFRYNQDSSIQFILASQHKLSIYGDSWRFPVSTTTLKDSSTGNNVLGFSTNNSIGNSPTNFIRILNNTTGSNPKLQSDSTSLTNVSLDIAALGTGSINFTTGSIGIGKTNPNAKLDVNGNSIISGSLLVTTGITGSLFGTASWSTNSLTASFITTAQTASYILNAVSSSFATNSLTASYVANTISSSYAVSSSYSNIANTASYSQLAQIASYTVSASFTTNAETASYVLNAISSSYTNFASTASYVLNAISSSFASTASYILNAISASYSVSSSFSDNSATASYITTAQTASYVTLAQTASYVVTAQTASYVLNAISASRAQTASYVLNAVSASYSITSSHVPNTFVQGGNSLGTAAILGTNDNQSLRFETNNSVRMQISSSGQIVYGGNTPLILSGGIFDGASPFMEIQTGTNIGTYNDTVVLRHTSIDVTAVTRSLGLLMKMSSEGMPAEAPKMGGMILRSTNPYANTPNLHFVIANTEKMTITNAGNVGIGTTTPLYLYRLDVSGAGRFSNGLTVNGAGATGAVLDTDTNNDFQSTRLFFKMSGSGNDVSIRNLSGSLLVATQATAGITSGTTTAMFISSSGNVAIGNIQPTLGNLQVLGNVYATSYTGSLFGSVSGNLTGTASYSTNAATASYFFTSSVTSASFTSTASYVLNAQTASYFFTSSVTSASLSQTASYVLNAVSSSYSTNSATASYFFTSSVTSASYSTNAETASYVVTAQTASYFITSSVTTASTASYVTPLTQSVLISGSLTVTGSINITSNSIYKQDGQNVIYIAKGTDSVYANTIAGANAGTIGLTRQTAYGGYAGSGSIGSNQTAVGNYAGQLNSGSNQTAVGYQAGLRNSGSFQTAVGVNAGYENLGTDQTAIGHSAGFQNSGSDNTNIGYFAGTYTTGTTINSQSAQSVFLGSQTTAGGPARTNQIVIGYNAIGIGNNSVVLGNSSIVTTALRGNIGIGTTTPTQKLTVSGGSILLDNSTALKHKNTSGTELDMVTLNAGNSLFLGSGQRDIYLRAGNNNILYVTSSAVGIGTSTPNATLDVNGNAIITGSLNVTQGITGSLFGTASWSNNAATASYVLNSISSSFAQTASYFFTASVTSASFATNSATASYFFTSSVASSSYSTNASTASYFFTASVTSASFAINAATASYFFTSSVTSASFAQTASYFFTASVTSASLAQTASYVNTLNQNVSITGSLTVSSSINSFNDIKLLNNATYIYGKNSSNVSTRLLGVNASNILYIGSVDAALSSILFNINGSNLLQIASSGDIGIGKINPTAKLDVSGSAIITGSLNVSAGITGSLFGTASYAINAATASYFFTSSVTSASFATNSATASYFITSSVTNASTASYLNTINQDLIFNGNLTLNGTASITYLNVAYESSSIIFSSGSNQFGDAVADTQTLMGTVKISGSLNLTGSANIPSITGSLLGTSSYSTNAATASYFFTSSVTSASFASTASYITLAQTASYFFTSSVASSSYATNASTASYFFTASVTSASFATNSATASYFITSSVTSASFASTSSYIVTAQTASYFFTSSVASSSFASTASYVLNSISSSFAQTASYFFTASVTSASFATNSATASYIVTAQTASYVLNSVSSSFASTASYFITGSVTSASFAQTASSVTILNQNVSITGSLNVSSSITASAFVTKDALITSTTLTANSGITTIYSIPTASYDGAWFDYTIRSGSNARAGTIFGLWSGSAVNYAETTTTDFGSTANFTFGMSINGANMILSSSTTTNGWTVNSIIRSV